VHVLALRSTFSFGLHAFGATEAQTSTAGFGSFSAEVPDGKFFAWLGQAQYIRRLFGTEAVLILRGTAQLSDEPLLALEQFSLGGVNTIRGYRENQILRDNGVAGTIELRLPVLFNQDRTPLLSLATFFDAGVGWDTTEFDDQRQTLSSAGLGIILSSSRYIQASVYWGYPFEDLGNKRESFQDFGWHFNLVFSVF
jgi:hemolysin activation/secretion protein